MKQAPPPLQALEPVSFGAPQFRLGVVCALHEELSGIVSRLEPHVKALGGREFWQASWHGVQVVAVLSRIGKVAAATTVSTLIHHFGVTHVVFSGVAGALGAHVKVGDVVVADAFVQHDMDASPLFPRFEVPLYGQTFFPCDAALSALLLSSAKRCLPQIGQHLHESGLLEQLGVSHKDWVVHHGLMASGDQFIGQDAQRHGILSALPHVLAVEMEGAAVAQVCHDFGLPFAAVRIISDQADDQAHMDFSQFIAHVAAPYGAAVVESLVQALAGSGPADA
jgi:adenosylhomocysteine nucleosidase